MQISIVEDQKVQRELLELYLQELGYSNFKSYENAEEFLNEFGGNAIKSPFQDGHYIYTVIAGGGSGQQSYAPILYIADLESPKNFNKKLQP